MTKIEKDELMKIEGGSLTFNATYLNAIYKLSDLLFEIGRELGSSIRRVSSNKVCPLKRSDITR
jgi:hypothetical protein